jgi:hypothetical protein
MTDHPVNRRCFFDRVGTGLMGAALLHLGQREGKAAVPVHDTTPKPPHGAPRARAIIQLCMQGGPSQVDLFDPKPALAKHHGQEVPRSLTSVAEFGRDRRGTLMRSPFEFARHGKGGARISNLLPHTAKEADHLAIIRSMYNVHPNHEPACYKWQSGLTFPGHPTLGAWITFGLGSVNQNLPAYVVLADPQSRLPVNGVENWMSGYLPPLYQGTPMRSTGSPLLNLQPGFKEPKSVTDTKRALLAQLDRRHQANRPGQPVLDARIRNYEMAARMQLEAAQTLDTSGESKATLAMYGIGEKETDSFGRRCLLARRLVERGVRFVQIYPRGQMWDNHNNIKSSLAAACKQTDLPTAGLLRDLSQRGLLDEVLILWGGEFGRLPMAQVGNNNKTYEKAGRDHGPYGFTSWMAGGGTRGGTVYGNTDEIGFASVENRVSIADWHATILHLLGLDYEHLTFDRTGLDEKITHVFPARVVKEILA